jgi:hypothetical protein
MDKRFGTAQVRLLAFDANTQRSTELLLTALFVGVESALHEYIGLAEQLRKADPSRPPITSQTNGKASMTAVLSIPR